MQRRGRGRIPPGGVIRRTVQKKNYYVQPLVTMLPSVSKCGEHFPVEQPFARCTRLA